MRTVPAENPSAPRPLLTLLTWVVLSAASLFTALWLWSCWCSFPSNPWNDIRVAPAIALHHGISIYTPAGSGPVSTWVYGPLPLFVMWPAGFATSAAGALEVAGAIHIVLRILVIGVVCWFWPAAPGAPGRNGRLRFGALLLAVLLVRNESSGYLVYSADAPGLAFGLLSLLALAHRRDWIAAACAAAAVACKQTLLGVAAAEIIWLLATVSAGAALRQALRCLAAGAVVAAGAIGCFGFPGLWHTMIELPAHFPWSAPVERLLYHQTYLWLHVVLPLAVIAAGRRFFLRRESPALLPALAFLCTLPLSFAGFLKIGGNVNALHSVWLFLPPALAALVSSPACVRRAPAGGLALATLAAVVAGAWLQTSVVRIRPNVAAYREAALLAQRLPGKIWFPMNPVVTLYSDHRFYHDYDGLLERVVAGQGISDAQFFAHMPRQRKVTATFMPIGWGPADQAPARLPANAAVSVSPFGYWQLQGSPE